MSHHWKKEEDALLVESLVELRLKGEFVAKKNFKAGYLQKLEEMLIEKAPGHGIRVVPHILSWMKTLRNNWQDVFDMVYRANTSEFGWDSERKKCVTAESAMWDAYLQVHYDLLFADV